jgi:hypothetical protein
MLRGGFSKQSCARWNAAPGAHGLIAPKKGPYGTDATEKNGETRSTENAGSELGVEPRRAEPPNIREQKRARASLAPSGITKKGGLKDQKDF